MSKPLVIYHKGCMDGAAAALAAWLKFGDEAEYRPASYGDPAPADDEVRGRDVYVLDFSYPRAELVRMANAAGEIVLLDHHKSAQADLSLIVEALSDVRRIPLANERGFAYVDSADAAKVDGYSWSLATHGGAVAYAGGGREKAKMISMHRLIMDAPDGTLVDHVNRNDVDNRRSNLRFATRQQNAANMDRGSTWKGVAPHGNKWKAQITVNGENRHLGVYTSIENAARAYDTAALQAFGEFALLNYDDRPKVTPANIVCTFDMSRSGAVLAWDRFHRASAVSGPPMVSPPMPGLFAYVQDRDLWRWELPHSKEISVALAASGALQDFRVLIPIYYFWDEDPAEDDGASATRSRLISDGAAILRAERQMIERAVATAEEVDIIDPEYTMAYRALAVSTMSLQSEIGEALALESARRGRDAVGVVYYKHGPSGKWRVSLRSSDTEETDEQLKARQSEACNGGWDAMLFRMKTQAPDVSAIARALDAKGGGHHRAAGCELTELPWVRR